MAAVCLSSLLEPSLVVWIMGKYFVAFNVMMLVIVCFYSAFVDKKGHSAHIQNWPDATKNKLLQVYLYLVSSYFLMCISVAFSKQSYLVNKITMAFPKHTVICSVLGITAMTSLLEKIRPDPENALSKWACWALTAVIMGPCFAFFSNDICIKAGICTSLAIILANGLALTSNTELYEDIKVKVGLLYVVVSITTGLCLLYLPPLDVWGSVIVSLNIYGGMLLYFGICVTNIQHAVRTMAYNDIDLVHTSAVIFLSSLNLYFRIAFFHVIEDSNMLSAKRHLKC